MKNKNGAYNLTINQLSSDQNHHRRKPTPPAVPVKKRENSIIGSSNRSLLWNFNQNNGSSSMGISARKLAAGLWHLTAEFTASGGDGTGGVKRRSGLIHPFHKSAMERVTKWDPGNLEMSREANHSNDFVKLCRHTSSTSVAPALELIRARHCIRELEAGRGRLRKKFKHVLRKLNEERISWTKREQQKTHSVVHGLKDDLRRERRTCKRLDVVNSKLLVDLADAKLSSKRYMQDYGKERKYRESLEEACNELVKKIEEEKTEIEALKSENARVGEEVEEERKMLQFAEVWCEERVQMKLIDAKLVFEEKYCLMSNLISELESFLRSAVESFGSESTRFATNISSSECHSNHFRDHDDSCKDASSVDRGSDKQNHEKNTGQSDSHDLETSEISSVFTKQSKKKGSSFRKLWRSTLSSDDCCKTMSLDESGRRSNGSTDNVDMVSADSVAERAVAYQDFAVHCCSGNPRNPHIARAMKGCIEWPRGIPKNSSKSKFVEARCESQKSRSRNILEHKS